VISAKAAAAADARRTQWMRGRQGHCNLALLHWRQHYAVVIDDLHVDARSRTTHRTRLGHLAAVVRHQGRALGLPVEAAYRDAGVLPPRIDHCRIERLASTDAMEPAPSQRLVNE